MKRVAFVLLMLASCSFSQTMDWGSGKPGHRVVTNETDEAAKLLIVSSTGTLSTAIQAKLDLKAGKSELLVMEGALQTESQARASTNALFSAWFTGLFSSTSNWNTALLWGDWHATVESNTLAIGVLSTGKLDVADSLAFLTSEADTNALTAIAALKVKLRWDKNDANVFDTLEGGTNWVGYRIGTVAIATNYTVTLSDDFMEPVLNSRPEWTNNVFPFGVVYDDEWSGSFESGKCVLWWRVEDFWQSSNLDFPATLNPAKEDVRGTATVSQNFVYPTNEWFRVDIESLTNINAVLQAILAKLTAISNTAAQAASDIESANVILNNHTAYGTIGSSAHLATGDRALIDSVPSITQSVTAVSSALASHTNDAPLHVSAADRSAWNAATNPPALPSGIITNNAPLVRFGALELANTQPTNLVLRLVCSNEHIIVQEVYQ